MTAPVPDHDILSTIEYWAFPVGLLIVFIAWIAEKVAKSVSETWRNIRSGER